MAFFYGPAGTTLLSHFQNLISLFLQPVHDGSSQAIINQYYSKAIERKKLVGVAIQITLGLFFITALGIWLLGSGKILVFGFSQIDIIWLLMALLVVVFQSLMIAILVSKQLLKAYFWLNFIAQVIMNLVLFAIGDTIAIHRFLLCYVGMLAFSGALFFGYVKIRMPQELNFKWNIDSATIKPFKHFLLMAISIWATSRWVDFFIRDYAIDLFGMTTTGLWQSVVKISEAYRGIYLNVLFVVFFPMVSKAIQQNQISHLLQFLKNFYKWLLPATVVFCITVWALRAPILLILYTDSYLAAADLFSIQIMGDALALLSFPLSILLMAQLRTGEYVALEVLSALTFVLSIVFMSEIGVLSLVYAHVIRFIVFFLFTLFSQRRMIFNA